MKKLLLFLVVFSCLTISCKKNSNEEPQASGPVDHNSGTLTDSTIIVNTDSCYTSLVSVDSVKIVFTNGGSGVAKIRVGSILASDMTTKAPDGFLRRVTGITISGGKKICKTVQASLTEALKEASVDFHKTFKDADVIGEDTSGIDISALHRGQSLGLNKLYAEVIAGVKISGEFKLEPTFHFKMELKDESINELTFEFVLKNTNKITAEATVDGILKDSIVLTTIELEPLTIPIGIFPLPIARQTIPILLGVNGEIHAKITAGAININTLTTGLTYTPTKGWTSIADVKNSLEKIPPAFEGEAKLEPWLQARYEIRPYGLRTSRFFLSATARLIGEAKAEINACNDSGHLSLDWGVRMRAKAMAKIFSKTIFDYDKTFLDVTYPIWRKDTSLAETFTDPRDGHAYKIKKFGTQTWMVEDLRYGSFPCDEFTDGFYNEFTGRVAPPGWHVPSDGEWTILANFLGGVNVAGGKMKDTCSTSWSWKLPNTLNNNLAGFHALPKGVITGNGDGCTHGYDFISEKSVFWTSTPSSVQQTVQLYYCRFIDYNSSQLGKIDSYQLQLLGTFNGWLGAQIRCVKN